MAPLFISHIAAAARRGEKWTEKTEDGRQKTEDGEKRQHTPREHTDGGRMLVKSSW
jgi:hypothetical protein